MAPGGSGKGYGFRGGSGIIYLHVERGVGYMSFLITKTHGPDESLISIENVSLAQPASLTLEDNILNRPSREIGANKGWFSDDSLL